MTRRGRRRLLILIAVIVAGGIGVVALKTVRSRNLERIADATRAEALELYAAEKWDEALPVLSRAVGSFKNDPEILLAFAETRRRNPEPRGRHLAEAFVYYQRVANVGEVQVGDGDGGTSRAADAVSASPAQLEKARIGLVELGPSLGRWTELADAAQDLLEATPRPSEDRRRQLVRALFQASLQQPEQAILDRYVTQTSAALAAARTRAAEIADSVDADIAAGGSRRTLDRSSAGNLRSLILAIAVEELDSHAVEARLGILQVLTVMGGQPDDLLALVRRWGADWAVTAGDSADARYASIESRLLLAANRLGPAAVLLAGVDDSRPVTDRRALEELVGAFDRMATIALQRADDRVFRAEIAAAADSPGQLSRLLLERAETLIEGTRVALGTSEVWPYELGVQWRFRLTREDDAEALLAEATEAGLTAQSTVLTRWSALLPLVAGGRENLESAAAAVVQLRRMGRDLDDPSVRDLTEAWGQALDRYLRYSPGVSPAVLATLNTFGLNAAAEAEADRIAAAEAETARRQVGEAGGDADAPADAGAEAADAAESADTAATNSTAGPVFDAIEAVLRAARAPSLGERTAADVPVALYLAARHTLAIGDASRAVNRFRAARRLWPAWPRAAAESINALVQNGQAARAAEELLSDRAWWQRGGFFPALQIAEAMVSLGPNGSDLSITLSGFNEPVGRLEMVERAFNVRGTYAEDGATGSWTPQGVRLLIQALNLDEGPDAVEALAAEAASATDAEIPVASLLSLAGAVGARDAELARSLIQRGIDADPTPEQAVLLQVELAELDGDRALAARLLADAASNSGGRVSGQFALQAALYRLADRQEEAVEEARRALSAHDDPVRLSALLDSSLLWSDPSVARAAIDRLTELTGPWSTPVRLAEARYALEGPAPEGTSIGKRRSEAFREIEAALRDAPGDPRLMFEKARLLIYEFGRDDRELRLEGIRQLDQAFNADQSNSRVALLLLPLLHEQQSWDRAGRVLDRVRSLRGTDPQLAVSLSGLYVQQGRIREAVDCLASFEDPPAAVQLRLIGLYTRIGEEAAADGLRTVLSARTDLKVDEATSLAVSRLNAAPNRTSDEAVAEQQAWLTGTLAGVEPAARSLAIAGFLASAGRTDQAMAEAEAALAVDPSLGDALAIVISVLVDRDGPAAAAGPLQRYLADVTPTESLVSVLPAVLTSEGLKAYPTEVQDRFERFVAETSLPARFAELRQRLADVRRRREASPDGNVLADPQVAVRAREIVREAPRVLTAHLLLMEALLAAGDLPGAVDAGLIAMEAFPGNVTAAEQTALMAARAGRSTDAVFAAREWFSRTDGSSVPAMNLLVGLLLDAGRPAAAIEESESFMVSAWRTAAEQSSETPAGGASRQLIFRWIISLAEAGDRRLARAADRALAEEVLPVLSVADAAARTTNRAIADVYVARARQDLAAEGDGAAPGRRLGQALLEQAMATRHADPAAATRALEFATPVMADEALGVDARVVMAQAHATRGERSTAIELYREALALAPQAFVIKNNLAFLLAVDGTDCEEAIRLAEEALAPIDAPQVRSAILSTLALSLACTGRNDEALERAQEAVALNRDAPDLLATLAYVQFRGGDTDGARANAATARRQINAEKFPAQYADAVMLLGRIDAGG